jgi:hypothetical protein
MLDGEDDIGADIRGAMESLSADAPAPAPEPTQIAVDDQGRVTASAETPAGTPPDGPARGPDGKFVAKADDKPPEAVQTQPEVKAPDAPADDPPQEDIVPPTRLSPEAKAQFKDWPPIARNEFRRMEADTKRGVEKLQQELGRFAPVDAALAPHREKWQMQGLDDGKVVQMLVAAHNFLERDPQNAIAYLARQYGVNIPQAGQATPAEQADPHVQRLQQQIATLQTRLQADTQSRQEQQRSQISSTIQAFAHAKDPTGNPAHLYFEDVREDMAALMEAGRADSLETAYEMATWARPDIRKLILAQERQAQDQATRERQAQHAREAKAAAGSVTGSTIPGARAAAVDPNASIEDDIRAAMQQASGRV